MTTQHTKSYEGKQYTFTTGTENGKSPIFIDPQHPHERTGQDYKLVFKSLYVEGDTSDNGNPVFAVTEWEEQHFDNKGNQIASYTKTERHKTSPLEFPTFIQNIMPLLIGSIYNGPVRGGKGADSAFLGHNAHPAFNPDGSFNPAEVLTPATYDYPYEATLNP